MILKGTVDVLVAKEMKIIMTEDEYYSYLIRLKKGQEYFILRNCLSANIKTLNVEQNRFFGRKNLKIQSHKICSEDNNSIKNLNLILEENVDYINYHDLIEKTRPFHNPDNMTFLSKLYELKVWQYFHIITLKSGEYFGDNAMSSQDERR